MGLIISEYWQTILRFFNASNEPIDFSGRHKATLCTINLMRLYLFLLQKLLNHLPAKLSGVLDKFMHAIFEIWINGNSIVCAANSDAQNGKPCFKRALLNLELQINRAIIQTLGNFLSECLKLSSNTINVSIIKTVWL